MMQRFELSRSDREIVYLDVADDGTTSNSIGLPDGNIIPYDEYVNPPDTRPRITPDTPTAGINTPPHRIALGFAATVSLVLIVITLLFIPIVAVHAF